MNKPVPDEKVFSKIHIFRGHRVMLDNDLAELYDVPVKVLNQAVKRNTDRFPEDFMFSLTEEEHDLLRSQSVTLKKGRGLHRKYLPYAFTENGVAMLSSVLSSKRAIQVNIQIMRIFTAIRKMLISHDELKRKIDMMEKKYDQQFKKVFDAIKRLLTVEVKPKKKIRF